MRRSRVRSIVIRMRTVLVLLFLVLLTTCAQPHWAEAVAAADPAFGGGEALEFMLRLSPVDKLVGDPLQRTRFLREQRDQQDAEAMKLVLELTTESAAAPALEFLRSDAGNAFVQAELSVIGLYPFHAEMTQQRTARFSDPAQVGESASRDVAHATQVIGEGGSGSPSLLAEAIGAARLTPDHAHAIGAFFTSDDGVRWLAVRAEAWARTHQRLQSFRTEARARGFLWTPPEDLEELILPPSTYRESAEPRSTGSGR